MTTSKDYQKEAQESKRRQAEDELRRNKDYLKSLNDSLSEAIITVDIPDNIDGRTVRYVNKAVEKNLATNKRNGWARVRQCSMPAKKILLIRVRS